MKKFGFDFQLFLIVMMQISCTGSKPALGDDTLSAEQNAVPEKILFINLNFWKIDKETDSCQVINTIIADGKLKEEEHATLYNKDNYYTVVLSSCNGKTLYTKEIDNQLDTQMEVYNENGSIQLKEVNFKQKEYSMRVQQGKEKICRITVTKNEKGRSKTIGNHLL